MRISLCLLVWNEVEGCKIDVPKLPQEAFDEIYAIDGGSMDGTVEFLQSQGIAVHGQRVRSLNAAYWQAIETSTCDAVVFFFPKGTLPPADLLKFRSFLEAGNELVVASRNIAGARNEEDDHFLKPRKWFVSALSVLTAILWMREGIRIRDVLHGVRAITIRGFRQLNPSPTGVSIDLETVVRSYRTRLSRIEFPTRESSRPSGETHFKALPTGAKLLRCLWHELTRR